MIDYCSSMMFSAREILPPQPCLLQHSVQSLMSLQHGHSVAGFDSHVHQASQKNEYLSDHSLTHSSCSLLC